MAESIHMGGTCHEPPTVNSLLIAERIFRDQETNEWVIAGVYNTLHVQRLPVWRERFEVFFQITNIARDVDLHLRIEHADSGEVVVDVGGPIRAENPLHVVEQRVVFQRIQFARDGKYWVQLLSKEEILTQAPLHVRVMAEVKNGGDHQDTQ